MTCGIIIPFDREHFRYLSYGDEIASHCHPAPDMLKYLPREVAPMLDFSRLEQYRENNRIEAKKALGGPAQEHLGDLFRLR